MDALTDDVTPAQAFSLADRVAVLTGAASGIGKVRQWGRPHWRSTACAWSLITQAPGGMTPSRCSYACRRHDEHPASPDPLRRHP